MRHLLHDRMAWIRGRARGEAGFSLIEAVMAMTIFVIAAAALGGLLTSAIAASKTSRERTIAEQRAMEQIEYVRRLRYDTEVGTTSGNPPGIVNPSIPVAVRGLQATMTTQIAFVNDPTPTSYATSANYKRVTVTITRNDNGKELARQVTYVAPPARAPFGGLNQGVIEPTVTDYALNLPVAGVTVNLATGPSAPRSDVTDASGEVTFAALTPTTPGPPTDYYDLSATKAGYLMLADPGTHLQLAPGQNPQPILQIYRPSTIRVELRNPDATPYTGSATVTVTKDSTGVTETFTFTGGVLTRTSFGGAPIVPNFQYTVDALSPTPYCAPSQTSYVPAPGDYAAGIDTKTFILTFGACPSGGVDATVRQLGNLVPGATVTLSGGPNGIAPITATTDSNGFVSFTNVPAGDGYVLQATKGAETASQTVSVAVNTVTSTIVTLPDPPGGGVLVDVDWGSFPANAASIQITGGPYGINFTGTADSTGRLTFPSVPAGSGYTVRATKGTTTNTAAATVTVGSTVTVPIVFPSGILRVTVRRSGVNVPNALVRVIGGPNGITTTLTTNGSGSPVQFNGLPAGNAYTVKAEKSPCSAVANPKAGTLTNQTVVAATTTNVTVTFANGVPCPNP
jgi:Tfp pilus assembly protein PilV